MPLDTKTTQHLRDLLAIIHRDGGHHTDEVGLEKSIEDAVDELAVIMGGAALHEGLFMGFKQEADKTITKLQAETDRLKTERDTWQGIAEDAVTLGKQQAQDADRLFEALGVLGEGHTVEDALAIIQSLQEGSDPCA